ncbi:tRNA-splicing endonuclease subunit Sen2 isoform X1 [Eleutherodactylus coqui]|uniref:tRNA-splicing endonuclease subunit Sen2 isoform X1 n=1 Tax=Eleutherodactylus coqui TaxID=57060 RepID=UPI0034631206
MTSEGVASAAARGVRLFLSAVCSRGKTMSQATFHAPRRKRKVYESYESPFPIPLSHDSYMKDFHICKGEIINNHVIVRSIEGIQLLYGKGYFGKGILSRSRPEYNIAQEELRGRWKDSKLKFPVISSIKYQHHVEWAKELLKGQGMDLTSANKILRDYTSPIHLLDEDGETVHLEDSKDELQKEPADKSIPTNTENIVREGNPNYDPLSKYGAQDPDTDHTCTQVDKAVLEKLHCHRHDDLIIHCGCKVQKQTLQAEPEGTSVMEEMGHEYVLVEEDTTGAAEDMEEETGEVKKLTLVCRRNPFRIFEYLQLSHEEAFFLVYALGCLSITYKKEPLTILKLWEVFSAAQQSFQTRYMAYHHFRSKGWVPKVGLKFGTDLLLYRKGPAFYHASYSVIVELVDENFEGPPLRPLTWRSLSGLHRTTMNVSKELLICYLIKPPAFTEKDMNTPECIKKFKVQEVIVNRWISSRERMEHEEL